MDCAPRRLGAKAPCSRGRTGARSGAKRNRSAEQKHREILKAALQGTRRKPLAEVLARMPNVGRDEDFRREQADRRR